MLFRSADGVATAGAVGDKSPRISTKKREDVQLRNNLREGKKEVILPASEICTILRVFMPTLYEYHGIIVKFFLTTTALSMFTVNIKSTKAKRKSYSKMALPTSLSKMLLAKNRCNPRNYTTSKYW